MLLHFMKERSLLDVDFVTKTYLKKVHSGRKIAAPLADFLYKTAFLKSKFEDDPVRVQKHNVPHFKDLE